MKRSSGLGGMKPGRIDCSRVTSDAVASSFFVYAAICHKVFIGKSYDVIQELHAGKISTELVHMALARATFLLHALLLHAGTVSADLDGGIRRGRLSNAAGSQCGRTCTGCLPLTSSSVACVNGCTRHFPSKFFISPGRASLKSICASKSP